MTSPAIIRNPAEDMLAPDNAALVIIDFQPVQAASPVSMERHQLIANVVTAARTARLSGLPVVLSTVNVETGRDQPTIHQLTDELPGAAALDRTPTHAWEDVEFAAAIRATGRKKLIMVALWS